MEFADLFNNFENFYVQKRVFFKKKYYLEIYLEFMNIFIAVRSDCYMFVDNAYT